MLVPVRFPPHLLLPPGRPWLACVLCCLVLAAAGCNSSVTPPTADLHANPALISGNQVRQQLDLIPLPSKTRYMAVHSLSAWENPYLTVQGNMVTLHVTLADGNTSELGQGGLLRPAGARQQSLNVAVNALPAALNAVPSTSWPYGRVIAVEEAHNVPSRDGPQVRRTLETVVKSLGDLGVIVYEWQEGGAGLR